MDTLRRTVPSPVCMNQPRSPWIRAVPMVPDRPFPVRMLAERFVRGDEYSVEMLVSDGRPLFANVTGKLLFPGPRPIELGHVVPANIPDKLKALLHEQTERVLRAVGFGTGVVHCEWIVSGGTAYFVECAGRFPGDGIVELIDRASVDSFITVTLSACAAAGA